MKKTSKTFSVKALRPVAGVMLVYGICSTPAMAQESDPEWPCIQRLVIEVSPAVMWPLPVEEAMHTQWPQDEDVRALAEELGDLAAYTELEQQRVENYVATIPAEDREHQLSLLAVGILDVSNRIRKQYINGIKRYTHQQIAIAEQIEDTLNQISKFDGEAGSGSESFVLDNSEKTTDRTELVETLRWHERVYDQREHAIRSLCDQPVEMEETLSDVLRDIAQYLP